MTNFVWQLKNNDLHATNVATIGQTVAANLNFDTVYGSVGLTSGRHFWELRIENMLDEHAVYIGVSSQPVTEPAHPGVWKQAGTYGWHCSRGMLRWTPQGSSEEENCQYGDTCDTSQVIGCLLLFNEKALNASLSFSINGKSLGTAFASMPPGKYYPMLSLSSSLPGHPMNSVILETRVKLPDCFKPGVPLEQPVKLSMDAFM